MSSLLLLSVLVPGLAVAQNAAEKAVTEKRMEVAKMAPAVSLSELGTLYPAGSVQSVVLAERALTDTEMVRTQIEAQFALDLHACYAKFFATACIDKVKEQRRSDVAQVKQIEVEANRFIRAARASERDQVLAERRTEAAAELLQREKESAGKQSAGSKK